MRSQFVGVGGASASWGLHLSKVHPRLPTTCQYKVLLCLPQFGRNSNVNCDPPIRLPFRELGWILGGPKLNQSKWRPHNPIRLLYTLLACLSCTVWPQYTTWQTDRAMAIGRLCSSIGGLKQRSGEEPQKFTRLSAPQIFQI